MAKLILQIAVAVGIWFALGAFDLHWGIRIVGIILGAIGVHVFWERVIFSPYDYLGVMWVADDDPVMEEAKRRAGETFDEFRKLYPGHHEDSMVKFRFETDKEATEFLWGDLLELTDADAKVFVRTPPVKHEGEFDRTMEVSVADIVDWQVELPDGNLRGGFTNRAMFKIFEREQGYMHPKFKKHVQRFLDA